MVLLSWLGTPLSPASLLRTTLTPTPRFPPTSSFLSHPPSRLPLRNSFIFPPPHLSLRNPFLASLLGSQTKQSLHQDTPPALHTLTKALTRSHANHSLCQGPPPSFHTLTQLQTNQSSGQGTPSSLRTLRRVFAGHSRSRSQYRAAHVTPLAAMGAQAEPAGEMKALGEAEIAEIKRELQEKAKIILGSSSFSRQTILREEMGLEFTILKANIDEKAIRFPDPSELVVALAKAKAEAIVAKMKAQEAEGANGASTPSDGRTPLLITSDQVVVYEGKILEKPDSPDEAREFMRGYSRAPAGTVGATMVTNLVTGAQAVAVDSTLTYFDLIPEESIDLLIKEGLVFYCAGGLCVEHKLVAPLVTNMEGTTDAVMGLPKETAWRLLRDVLHS